MLSVTPCFADEPGAAFKRPLAISDAALTSASAGSGSPRNRPIATLQTAPAGAGGSAFFKTTKGAIVLALLGAGLGYGVYSKLHDRVHSPNPAR
jgi:hypothetical protein